MIYGKDSSKIWAVVWECVDIKIFFQKILCIDSESG